MEQTLDKPWVIFSATHEEILPLLQDFGISPNERYQDVYRIGMQNMIVVTGIGPYAAHKSAMLALSHVQGDKKSRWLNIGICGAFGSMTSLQGSWIHPKSISLLSWKPRKGFIKDCCIDLDHGHPQHDLHTSPLPVYNSHEIQGIEMGYIDMEAYPIVQVAQTHGISCKVAKIVSDMCSFSSPEEIRENLQKLSHHISHAAHLWIEERM